jgi:hypothetical protein
LRRARRRCQPRACATICVVRLVALALVAASWALLRMAMMVFGDVRVRRLVCSNTALACSLRSAPCTTPLHPAQRAVWQIPGIVVLVAVDPHSLLSTRTRDPDTLSCCRLICHAAPPAVYFHLGRGTPPLPCLLPVSPAARCSRRESYLPWLSAMTLVLMETELYYACQPRAMQSL